MGLKLKQAVGQWVEGDRFWDRHHEVDDFIRLLDEGAHILLAAPRRVGKTSLMREVSRRIRDRYVCLHLDVQDGRSPADLVVELGWATRANENLWSKTVRGFSNLFDMVGERVDELGIDEIKIKLRQGVAGDWQGKAERLLANLASAEQPVVLFIDELPILVNRMLQDDDGTVTPERRGRTEVFLSWLRSACAAHQGRLRFVVAGSIGLEPVLGQAGLSATINHFTPFALEPWDRRTADECLEALAEAYQLGLPAEVRGRMVEHLGCCIPHHVQLFFDHVRTDAKRRAERHVTAADVDRVYHERMLGSRGHVTLSHYEERLQLVLKNGGFPLSLDLLTEAAVEGSLSAAAAGRLAADHGIDAVGRPALLREVLGILEHDGYLRRRDDAYVFVSSYLRDWWRARFGFGFQPAAQRKA